MAAGNTILSYYKLAYNPYTDRIAERYVHSDLAGFKPSETTYLFFGKRGSGKTTIRMRMQNAYEEHNEQCRRGDLNDKPFLVVDLCKPGVVTAALKHFKEHIGAQDSSWDYQFEHEWCNNDMVDLVLATAITQVVGALLDGSDEGAGVVHSLSKNPRACKQFLLLASLYAEADSDSLSSIRKMLMLRNSWYWWATRCIASASAVSAASIATHYGMVYNNRFAHSASSRGPITTLTGDASPARTIEEHPRTALVCASAVSSAGAGVSFYKRRKGSLQRERELQQSIRVAPRRSIRHLIDRMFRFEDSAETIRANYIGNSIHSKLDFLRTLAKRMGYKDVAVFGDCFDEVSQLDPISCPKAIKRFAREVCRNDFLNFGRMHFYFPDSRIALDLNTDRVLKDARFVRSVVLLAFTPKDRHFVRDLVWSRHQLQDLAQRRFMAAQVDDEKCPRFTDLFNKMSEEDFASCLAKLESPRELLIMMTEMFSRMEAHREDGFKLHASDLEQAVQKAHEQASH